MKRLAYFVCLLVIALPALQLAVFGLPCVFGPTAACVPGCPMQMSGMSPDCPMAVRTLHANCERNCCSHPRLQTIGPLAASDKLRLVALAPSTIEPAQASVPDPIFLAQTGIEIRSASPPIYILNQVFRI